VGAPLEKHYPPINWGTMMNWQLNKYPFVKFSNKILMSIKHQALSFLIPIFNSSMPDIIACPIGANKAYRKCKSLSDRLFESFYRDSLTILVTPLVDHYPPLNLGKCCVLANSAIILCKVCSL